MRKSKNENASDLYGYDKFANNKQHVMHLVLAFTAYQMVMV